MPEGPLWVEVKEAVMPKQWMYTLAFLFVLFLIYADPSGAGEFAGSFFGMLGRLASGTLTFFQNAASSTEAPDLVNSQTTTTVVEFGGLNPGLELGTVSN